MLKQKFAVIQMPNFRLPLRNNPLYKKLHQKPRLSQRLQKLLLLACSLLVGMLPPLLWLLLLTAWYYLPVSISPDIGVFTMCIMLLSPFAAGFARGRWQDGDTTNLTVGALPAFLLWLAAFLCYYCLFRTFAPQKTLLTLVIALLLGIAGAMSATKIKKIKQPQPE
jgi:hypothetical protein